MKLNKLTDCLKGAVVSGDTTVDVCGVTADSRMVTEGMVYVAIKGETLDGADFIPEAIERGAVAVVADKAADSDWDKSSWVHVKDTRAALAILACLLEGEPSKKFKLVGVTGTNGKTTTSYMIHHILQTIQLRSGLIGTIMTHDGIVESPTTHTTPYPVVINQLLRGMADNGCRSVAMEVSSHGIEQKRVHNLDFDVLVFTNLTQDHLDYHGSMDKYFDAKRKLFIEAAKRSKKIKAVVNIDDPYGARLAKEFAEKLDVHTFGMGVHCNYRFGKIKQSVRGVGFELKAKGKSYLVRIPTIGRFNVYNAASAIISSVAVGVSARDAVRAIAEIRQVPGRIEHVESKMGVSVFVDYAHTPDALASVCKTLKDLEPKRLITVFGCGGDRDRTKRPLMARAAGESSDLCFITSDNPRSEDPESILKDVEKGMMGCPSRSIVDREEAIKTAVAIATGGDIVLIAGKGHEDYQIFKDETIPFDDRIKARSALREFKIPNIVKEREEQNSNDSRFNDRDDDRRRDSRDGDRDGERRDFRGGDRDQARGGDRRRDSRGGDRDRGRD